MNGRGWKVMLVSSLVLNVFLLGGIAGGAYQWFSTRSEVHATAAQQPVALRFAAEGLSSERQREFVDGIKLARREARQSAREARDERIEVMRLLSAPQMDRAAVEAALEHARQADVAVRTSVEQSVVDFAVTLTPDERRKFVEGLEHRGQWRLTAKEQARLASEPDFAHAVPPASSVAPSSPSSPSQNASE
jgi:uncharacterized membrane protein